MKNTRKKKSNEVIVVLGGGLTTNDTLPPHVRARLKTALKLMRKKNIPRIICAGWYGFTLSHIPRISEAHVMKIFLRQHGVPSNAILCEEQSKDTIGNAFFVKTLFLNRFKWNNVTVVTSRFHAKRTRYIFQHVLGNDYHIRVIPAPNMLRSKELTKRRDNEKRLLQLTHLWLGRIPSGDDKKLRQLLRNHHPGYTKNVHPFTKLLLHFITNGQH